MTTNTNAPVSRHLSAMSEEASAIASNVVKTVKDAVETKKTRALRAVGRLAKKAGTVQRHASGALKKRPFTAVGTALAVGLALGALAVFASRKRSSGFLGALGLA